MSRRLKRQGVVAILALLGGVAISLLLSGIVWARSTPRDLPTGYWIDVDESGFTASGNLGGSGSLAGSGQGNVNYGYNKECAPSSDGGPFSIGHYPPLNCAQVGRSYSATGSPESPSGFWFTGNQNCVNAGRPFSGSTFTWHVNLPQAGPWHVDAYIPNWTSYGFGNQYILTAGDGQEQNSLTQQAYHGQWIRIFGDRQYSANQDYTVQLTLADTADSYCHYQMADQMRWVYDGAPGPPPTTTGTSPPTTTTTPAPTTTSTPSGARPSALQAGQWLQPGQALWSPNGSHEAAMQTDGNFVVYAPGRAIWSSGTARHPGARLAMQRDGNLVIYAANGKALWNTGTRPSSNDVLIMQDDGNLVVYSAGRALWSSQGGLIPKRPVNTRRPGITGTPGLGQRLSCSAGTWSNHPNSYLYRWARAAQTIIGATSSTYTVTLADTDRSLSCIVTARNGAGSTAAASTPVFVPKPVSLPLPPPPPRATRFSSPDFKAVQYIKAFGEYWGSGYLAISHCIDNLVSKLGMEPSNAGLACALLDESHNPDPPASLSGGQWNTFKSSDQYRSFVHLPAVTVSCSDGHIKTYSLAGSLEHSSGYTPLSIPGGPRLVYEPGESYTQPPYGRFYDQGQPTVSTSSTAVTLNYLSAARIASLARGPSYSLLGYDAPFIWIELREVVGCDGYAFVPVFSDFPTSYVYLNDKLAGQQTQSTDLAVFIASGTKNVYHSPGVGNFDPHCQAPIRRYASEPNLLPLPVGCGYANIALNIGS
jgi:hypothetical protein